jgi:hypothetical protein
MEPVSKIASVKEIKWTEIERKKLIKQFTYVFTIYHFIISFYKPLLCFYAETVPHIKKHPNSCQYLFINYLAFYVGQKSK